MPSRDQSIPVSHSISQRPVLIQWALKSSDCVMLAALLPVGLLGGYSLYITSSFVQDLVQDNNQSAARIARQLISNELTSSFAHGGGVRGPPKYADSGSRA